MAMSSAHVSLAPTSASGLLCNSSPLATAIAVATTEADVHALANVVGRQHTPQPGTSWAVEMYGPPQPPSVVVAALHPLRSSGAPSTTAAPSTDGGAVTDDTPFATPPPAADILQDLPQQIVSPPSQRLSIGRAGSLAGSDAAALSSATLPDATTGQPFAVTVTTTTTTGNSGPSRLRKNVSWQCGLCGYHVLAMDQDGTPLPFTTSAFGNMLPLLCPRCKLSHTSWQPSTPFNEQGDHLNLPTTYSNRYVAPSGASAAAVATEGGGAGRGAENAAAAARPDHAPTHTGTLLSQRAAAATQSLMAQQRAAQLRNTGPVAAARQRRAYYCGRCSRRLLRVDANGELVDMDREADGSIRPIRCPGCGESHGDWVVKPYAVRR